MCDGDVGHTTLGADIDHRRKQARPLNLGYALASKLTYRPISDRADYRVARRCGGA